MLKRYLERKLGVRMYLEGASEKAIFAACGLHEQFSETARDVLNVPGMLPAAVITYGALINNIAPLADALAVKETR